jgi:hypothetical protein
MYSGHPYYGYFANMIKRGNRLGRDFSLGEEDFNKWLGIIGLIPEDMSRPSVGRVDHSKGYVFDQEKGRWNFRWQELSDNHSEGGTRGAFTAFSSEQRTAYGKLGGKRAAELGRSGFQNFTPEQRSEYGRESWKDKTKEEIMERTRFFRSEEHKQCVDRWNSDPTNPSKTEVLQAASAASLNHVSKRIYVCRVCGKECSSPLGKYNHKKIHPSGFDE